MKKQNGYATVEAAIVIPIVILSIISILFVIKVFYIQNIVQTSLDEACNEMSYLSYLYDKSKLLDVTNDLESHFSAVNEDMKEQYGSVKDDLSTIAGGIDALASRKYPDMNAMMGYKFNGDFVKSIGGFIDLVGKTQIEITETVTDVQLVVGKSTFLINSITGMATSGNIKAIAGDFILTHVETYVGNEVVKGLMKKNIDEELMSKMVHDGYDGLDMSLSNYFYEDDYSTNVIDVVLVYKVKLPVPFFDGVKLTNRVKIDTWTGQVYGN